MLTGVVHTAPALPPDCACSARTVPPKAFFLCERQLSDTVGGTLLSAGTSSPDAHVRRTSSRVNAYRRRARPCHIC